MKYVPAGVPINVWCNEKVTVPRQVKIAKIISYRTKLLTEDYRTQREEYANRRLYLKNTNRMEQSIAVRSTVLTFNNKYGTGMTG